MTDPTRAQLRALRWALAGYTVFVAVILGWRTPTTPVVDTLAVVSEQVRAIGAEGWLTDPRIEFLANIALFVPFGLLLAAVLRPTRWWWAVVAGFGYSLTAEIAQGIWRPQRSGTVSDVIANTLGALLGAGLAVLIARRLSAARAAAAITSASGPSAAATSAAEKHDRAEVLAPIDHAADADLGQARIDQAGANLG
ncbi:MAG: VanZ family protein [Cellulomonas sp.]